MEENVAKEKLRVIDIIKENAALVISVAGFVWLVFQFLIMPVAKLQYDVGNILNNHLETIQNELTEAKTERKAQGLLLNELTSQIIKLQVLIEKK
jgi:F0F1-type ATP synthase membrane subunit b/b'